MPGIPTPGRPGGEHDEPLLDMIFDGRTIPPDAPQEMHDLERMLAALAGPAEPGELAGEAAARAAFELASPAGISHTASRPATHQVNQRLASHRAHRRRPARRRAGLATALCAAAAVMVSTAAAYAGVLPEPIQRMAHVTVGAPAPRHHATSTRSGSGSRQDTRHGPVPRLGRSADAAWSPGHARVAPARHEPPRIRPWSAPTCGPGPGVYQVQPGTAPGWTPSGLQQIWSHCSEDPGKLRR